MSNRLVITFKENDVELGKVYFHEGASVCNSITTSEELLRSFEGLSDIKDTKLRIIHATEQIGGCLCGVDRNKVFKLYPNESFIDDRYSKYSGLVAITEQGMGHLQRVSEGDIVIDLSDEIVYNTLVQEYKDLDELKEAYGQNTFKEISYNPSACPFENINTLAREIKPMNFYKYEDIYFYSEE